MKLQSITLLCYGALATAIPAQAGGQFHIKVTAPWPTTKSPPQSFYLSNKGDGSATEKKENAAKCSISAGKLSCSDKEINAPANGLTDMAKATSNRVRATDRLYETNFEIDKAGKLHWRNDAFGPMKEAQWSLGKDHQLLTTGRGVFVWANLNCPTHGIHSFHGDLSEGYAEAVPVA